MILPTPADIREARQEIGFSQARAARMVHATESAWRKWETSCASDEYRVMGGATWELFICKTDSRRKSTSRFSLKRCPL